MGSEFNKMIREFVDTIKDAPNSKPSPYDTQAEVRRVDGDIAWVHIPGGVDETPVQLTTNAKKGDIVQVRISGGNAWLYGNQTAPPTDDTKAIIAEKKAVVADEHATNAITSASIAQEAAESAQSSASDASSAAARAWNKAGEAETAAESAQSSASDASSAAARAWNKADEAETHAQEAKVSATNAGEYAARALGNLATVQSVAETLTWITQHGTMALTTDTALDPTHVYFVRDANGDYTVGSYTYSIVTEPVLEDISTYYELTIDESLNNYVGTHLALTNEGLWLLPASSGTNKVLIATGAGSSYTIAGTYIIGSIGETLASFRTDGLSVYTYDNNNSINIAHLGYGLTYGSSGEEKNEPYYTIGVRKDTDTIPEYDSTKNYTIGQVIKTPGAWPLNHYSVSIANNPSGGFDSSCWQPLYNTIGEYSIVEGIDSIASGKASHAEGEAIARGAYSHAEGYSDTTSYGEKSNIPVAGGIGSHVEGCGTLALGADSHAEGTRTKASSNSSHAEGNFTKSTGYSSHSEGDTTTASGNSTHAEGYGTYATGDYSHTQNYHTYARRDYQTAIGKYNIQDYSVDSYALIIGNGTDSERSNALTVDWFGDVQLALNTSAQSGTTDGDLYSAITALSWESEVLA